MIPDYGGAIIKPHPGLGYFKIPMPRMMRSWQQGWFYALDLPKELIEVGLPPFENLLPQEVQPWSSDTNLTIGTNLLVQEVLQLKDSWLKSMQILKTWLDRNIHL